MFHIQCLASKLYNYTLMRLMRQTPPTTGKEGLVKIAYSLLVQFAYDLGNQSDCSIAIT